MIGIGAVIKWFGSYRGGDIGPDKMLGSQSYSNVSLSVPTKTLCTPSAWGVPIIDDAEGGENRNFRSYAIINNWAVMYGKTLTNVDWLWRDGTDGTVWGIGVAASSSSITVRSRRFGNLVRAANTSGTGRTIDPIVSIVIPHAYGYTPFLQDVRRDGSQAAFTLHSASGMRVIVLDITNGRADSLSASISAHTTTAEVDAKIDAINETDVIVTQVASGQDIVININNPGADPESHCSASMSVSYVDRYPNDGGPTGASSARIGMISKPQYETSTQVTRGGSHLGCAYDAAGVLRNFYFISERITVSNTRSRPPWLSDIRPISTALIDCVSFVVNSIDTNTTVNLNEGVEQLHYSMTMTGFFNTWNSESRSFRYGIYTDAATMFEVDMPNYYTFSQGYSHRTLHLTGHRTLDCGFGVGSSNNHETIPGDTVAAATTGTTTAAAAGALSSNKVCAVTSSGNNTVYCSVDGDVMTGTSTGVTFSSLNQETGELLVGRIHV